MKKFRNLFLLAVFFSGLSHACTKPEAPVLPDGVRVPAAQIDEVKNEVAAYVAAAQAYIVCAAGVKPEHQNPESTSRKRAEESAVPRL